MTIEMTAGPTEDTLGPLLNVLAQSLDVREVLNQISPWRAKPCRTIT